MIARSLTTTVVVRRAMKRGARIPIAFTFDPPLRVPRRVTITAGVVRRPRAASRPKGASR